MPLTQEPKLLGAHVFFFREGDASTLDASGATVASFNVTKLLKPGALAANWINVGVIEDAGIDRQDGVNIEIYGPTPGRQRLIDHIDSKSKMTIKFTLQEFGPFAVENVFRTLALTSASTQANQEEGRSKKGWLKLQLYDHNDVQVMIMDQWAKLMVPGGLQFGSENVKPQFEALCLHSIYNTLTL